MGFRHTRKLILTLATACALAIVAPGLRAQQDASSGTGGGQSGDTTGASNGAPQNVPGPVGGVEQYNLGEGPSGRSFVIPRLSLQELYDSNTGYAATTGASQGDAVTSIYGGLTLQVANRRSLFSMAYSSGGLLYNTQTQSNGVVQQLNATEKITLRRWTLLMGENFSYLPNSEFGLGGQGFLGDTTGLPGIGVGTGFNPYVVPTQTIVAPNVSQLSSATVFQAQYFVNPTSSINGSATVGFLHFFGENLLNSRNVTARFGYDKSLTVKDTISFSYMASILDYPSGISGFTSQYVQVGYRRLIKQRLVLSLSTGPVISHFSPQMGQTTVAGEANLVDWSTFATLAYQVRRGSLNAQYTHGVAGGSGFFPGTTADQLTVGLSRLITRVWSVGFTGGYARNSSLEQTSSTGTMNTTSTFNSWYGGSTVSRPLGHYSSLQFYYNVSRQTGNTTVCVNGISCGSIALTQTGGMTITWSTRPRLLD